MIPLPYLGETEIEEYRWANEFFKPNTDILESFASKLNDSRRECEELKDQLAESERARKIAERAVRVALETCDDLVNALRYEGDRTVRSPTFEEMVIAGEGYLIESGEIAPREES